MLLPYVCFCMSEVISSFRSFKAGSQVSAHLILFLCVIVHVLCLRIVLVCHKYDHCENYVGSVYIGGYGGLSES